MLETIAVGWLAATAGCAGGDDEVAAAATVPSGEAAEKGLAMTSTSGYGIGGYGLGGYGVGESVTPTATPTATATATETATPTSTATPTPTPTPKRDRGYGYDGYGEGGYGGMPVVCSGCGTPSDPDGDGRFEDVNGNNRTDFNDIVVFFDRQGSAPIQDNPTAYDFNGNGRIDFDDIVTLFNEI